MPDLYRCALLPLAVEDAYAIVTDVGSYPGFMPWCKSVEVHERGPEGFVATLVVDG